MSSTDQLQQVKQSLGALHKANGGLVKSFTALEGDLMKSGALDSKVKELMAVAIAVATRCEPCISFHLDKAQKHGASQEEINEALNVAVLMSGGPGLMYAAKAQTIAETA